MATIERTQTLMTVEDVAARCNVSVSTVRRLIARGEMPARRIGGQFRFDPDQLTEWLSSQRQRGDCE